MRTRRSRPSTRTSRSRDAGWGKDYPDASTFAVLFDGRIIPTGNINYSLIERVQEQLQKINGFEGLRGPSERRRRHRRLQRDPRRRRASRVLGGVRPEADGGGRAVGAVPRCERELHHEPERHAVGVRPVATSPGYAHVAVDASAQ